MLKMDGIKSFPGFGMSVAGKLGRYRIKQKIGKGGNGAVFAAEVIEGGDSLPEEKTFAIKFLAVKSQNEKEFEKRKARFRKEIEQVIRIQDKNTGIIPIYDAFYYLEENQEFCWYLMPLAKEYMPKQLSVLQKLEHMKQLGICIKQLHDCGYAHRDIKPKNLLIYNGQICLSDFGLVWNQNEIDEHITEVNDRLGPVAIRPPELQPVEKIDGVDYRKSDVYLYAKTVWMVLRANNSGFPREYRRSLPEIYLDKEDLQIETAEPLHRLLEGATKHNYWERIDIEDCIQFIDEQISVIQKTVDSHTLIKWKYDENTKQLLENVPSDATVYQDPVSIIKVLNGMADTAALTFIEAGRKYESVSLKRAAHIEDCMYELVIKNPYDAGRRRIIEMAIKDICMKNDLSCEIHTCIYTFGSSTIQTFNQITKALECGDRRVRLNGNYLITKTSHT